MPTLARLETRLFLILHLVSTSPHSAEKDVEIDGGDSSSAPSFRVRPWSNDRDSRPVCVGGGVATKKFTHPLHNVVESQNEVTGR